MLSRRVAVTLTAIGAAQLAFGAPAGAAQLASGAAPLVTTAAHGALSKPVSRAAACGPEGGEAATSRACAAAVAKNGPDALDAWDEIRVPGVAGRDRQVIADGRLCSGGLVPFRGLDLARGDWPATTLAAGAAYDFTYRATIPHKGTFRMYVTKDGYSPTRPLTWAALESRPFLRVTDPRLSGGAYHMKGRLPKGKTGRHLIYTVWQNSDTPDTYYSCSDVVFAASSAAPTREATDPPGDTGTADGTQDSSGDAGTGEGTHSSGDTGTATGANATDAPASSASSSFPASGTILVAGGAVALLLCAGVVVALARRADRRAR
ncbi:lytic polysaccharide monooxygenase auxiliary activity family 9 protein [Sphaerisporangium corydalis]|uniref:Lytic polysaccharide monooxygenase n=1 Tax=Sphaerisporangium corydalis TaxID=1441875 RepID=A0ABV9E913_9ACTN|nr:lytic polysaccharide monooxygenase [Sphaerisporangium corydalis]